ncbi:hypothetical protein PoB_002063600 [Plakobranchus ocellatus]|uniref:Uncharacterized protein n=1 Tax=Plakobranchus ocellatus TaxID=259542 RepID=A0AAV3Z4A7_9GAST|nr:hypothetical protein PoB_002063600 [Plakobranchus ocellatus]
MLDDFDPLLMSKSVAVQKKEKKKKLKLSHQRGGSLNQETRRLALVRFLSEDFLLLLVLALLLLMLLAMLGHANFIVALGMNKQQKEIHVGDKLSQRLGDKETYQSVRGQSDRERLIWVAFSSANCLSLPLNPRSRRGEDRYGRRDGREMKGEKRG